MKRYLLFVTLAFLLLTALPARSWNGEVVKVQDGDSIIVRAQDGARIRIRLHGIDTPEGPGTRWKPQPYSRIATDFVKALLPPGSVVAVMDMGYDKYERTVAGIVSLPNGQIVQEELLRAGLAWVYPKYCTDCRQWKALEAEARKEGLGLWNGAEPVPPWKWRAGAAGAK